MFGLFQTIASPFCEKYWSWYKEKQGEGFEIISFALKRPHFAPLPLQQIEFAGKVNVSVVLQDYLVHSTPINWADKCVSSREVRETVSCVYFYLCHLFFLWFVFQFKEDLDFCDFLLATREEEKVNKIFFHHSIEVLEH